MQDKRFGVLAFSIGCLLTAACGGHEDSGNKTSSGGAAGTSSSTAGGDESDASGGGGSSNRGGSATAGGTSKSGAGSGGAGNNNQSGFDSGLPKDKPLNSLSSDEQQAMCDKLKTYFEQTGFFDTQQELSCRAAGLLTAITTMAKTDADVQAACKSAYDSCAAAPAETTDECTPPGADCTATVGELSACISDLGVVLGQEKQLFPPCDELTLAGLSSFSAAPPDLPPACKTYNEKCPDNEQVPGMP